MKIVIVFLMIVFISCKTETKQIDSCLQQQQQFDSLITSQKWKLLQCGLYQNRKRDLGFQSFKAICKEGVGKEFYITKFSYTETELKNVIDTISFKRLKDDVFVDKNYKYLHKPMAYGGIFNIIDTLKIKK